MAFDHPASAVFFDDCIGRQRKSYLESMGLFDFYPRIFIFTLRKDYAKSACFSVRLVADEKIIGSFRKVYHIHLHAKNVWQTAEYENSQARSPAKTSLPSVA